MQITTKTSMLAGALLGVSCMYIYTATKLGLKLITLKQDNIDLLAKTLHIIGVTDTEMIPEEILVDIEFRRMAAVAEAEKFPKKVR